MRKPGRLRADETSTGGAGLGGPSPAFTVSKKKHGGGPKNAGKQMLVSLSEAYRRLVRLSQRAIGAATALYTLLV